MAAVLKKRALAEFSQVLQEDQPKPPKKLRLSKRSKTVPSEVDLSNLSKASSPHDVLQILLQLEDSLPLQQSEDSVAVLRRLLDHFHKEKESAVRVKLINLVAELAKTSSLDPSNLIDELISLLKNETSHKVISQLLDSMSLIVKGLAPNDGKLQQRVLTSAKQYLSDTSHQVKCKCLQLISELTPMDGQLESNVQSLRVLGDYCHCQDPRVRTAAFAAMLKLHDRGLKLDMSIYEEITKALTDDYEGVRQIVLKLLWTYGQIYPEHPVPVPESHEQIRLIDSVFAKICNSINDLSMTVRTQAAQLLGSMTNVNQRFLEQTLDKKLISNMRRKQSAHERQKENYESGEWATGHKWADDAPKEVVDTETISIINSGACGAFVHGLEDEYLEVRTAAVESLSELAIHFPSFAIQSIDFLVDMFNDEIEDVRLKAIHALTNISRHIVLREDQLETILAVLEDSWMDIREALHIMLATCHLSSKACLKMCIDNLLENLKRYPQDRRSIWKCLQKLGARHPELTLPLVPELLGIHPYLDMPEPDMDDPAYISILILVFNAAANCPTMMPLFEQHTLRHYLYLQDSMPHLVPHLKLPNQADMKTPIQVSTSTESFLQQVLDRVAQAECMSPRIRLALQETAMRDLQRLSEIDPSLSAAASCTSLYIQCQLLFTKVLYNKNWSNPSSLALQQGYTIKNAIEQILRLTFQLSNMFLNLTKVETACVRQMRLKALALQLVYIVRGSNSSALALCEHFLDQVESLQRFLLTNNLQPDAFTDATFREMDRLDEPKPGAVARLLQPLLQSYQSPALKLSSSVQQAKATIYEPTGESDNALKFTSGLILGVPLDAEVENIEDVKVLRIKVKYPDQQTQLILPRLSDFREISVNNHRLITTVLLSHNIWSEACHVEIGLVVDFSESEVNAIRTHPKSSKADENTIELCKSVKVYISPKPAKKGL